MNQKSTFGHNDWMLPSRRNLFSLVSHTEINPALDKNHPFTDVFSGYYWTSQSCTRLKNQAWYIHLGGARVHRGMKHGSYMVWPVRSSQQIKRGSLSIIYEKPSEDVNLSRKPECFHPRFVEENASVYDRLTGLWWSRDADLAKGPVTWSGALETIDSVNTEHESPYNDWRLPNVRELESLVDLGQHSPALARINPFENTQPFYWSSTTSVYESSYAWVIYFQDGSVGVGYKPNAEFFVWAVRG
jgi:hypothetical protein